MSRTATGRLPFAFILAMAVVGAAALAGCAGMGGSRVGNNEGVSNTPGSFSYGGQVSAKSGTNTYEWQNGSTRAFVSWGGQSAAGNFLVVVKDSVGRQVYSNTFGGASGGASQTTAVGTPGAWTIGLTFNGFTGNMGLSVTAS